MNNLKDIDFGSISEEDAANLGPFLPGDGPCSVTCYGKTRSWKSRLTAIEFYRTGALACEGSESDRYWNIVSDLETGNPWNVVSEPGLVSASDEH